MKETRGRRFLVVFFIFLFAFAFAACGGDGGGGSVPVVVPEPPVVEPPVVVLDPAELRAAALQFLWDYNTLFGHYSGVRRWASTPIIIEISSEIVSDGYVNAYKEASDFWTQHTGITFQIVESLEPTVDPMWGKDGVVFFEYGTPSRGGAMSIWTDVSEFVHLASRVTVSPEHGGNATIIAHEIGHSLGIWDEVNNGTIVDHYARWVMDPVAAEALKILYFELEPGDPVPGI